jgi:WD40 repeat protein/predicted Ser/Thr protein kinase
MGQLRFGDRLKTQSDIYGRLCQQHVGCSFPLSKYYGGYTSNQNRVASDPMSLCINPQCQKPNNPDTLLRCQSCSSELLLEGRYRVMGLLGKGGFAKTYEVSDRTNLPKVLKVLIKNAPKPVEQFQREAQVLKQLNHPGIPQGEEYFTFLPQNSQEPVHCLVMEKIEGENLLEWLKNRGDRPISEKLAVDWLKQLANTLHNVHQQQLIHRDIKPSNIMLKPDGQLVLIDFGIAREITKTYEQKKAAGQVTRNVTDGYSPLEQVIGCAVLQSDLFALGRTFVHLLTGIPPVDLCDLYHHDMYTAELEDWRDKAPQISSVLGDFIDQLMARPIQERPADTQAILQQLAQIENTLYPQRLSTSHSSNSSPIINEQNISLEYSLGGSWDAPGHSKAVRCIAISSDCQTLVSCADDATIRVWNLSSGDQICTLVHSGYSNYVIKSVAIASDEATLVSGDGRGRIEVWNFRTSQRIRVITEGSYYAVRSLVVGQDGQTLVSGISDAVIAWNLNTGKQIRAIEKHSDSVTAVALSPDGQTLVSGSTDRTIKVYPKSRHPLTLTGHEGAVNSLVISSNSQTLVSGSDDTTIKVWDLNGGEEICTFTGHAGAVNSVAISPDGQTIASGSDDETITLWNLNTEEKICTLDGHLDGVNAVAFSKDGLILASAGGDCTIKVWRIQ